jgi:hypothetical protein
VSEGSFQYRRHALLTVACNSLRLPTIIMKHRAAIRALRCATRAIRRESTAAFGLGGWMDLEEQSSVANVHNNIILLTCMTIRFIRLCNQVRGISH